MAKIKRNVFDIYTISQEPFFNFEENAEEEPLLIPGTVDPDSKDEEEEENNILLPPNLK